MAKRSVVYVDGFNLYYGALRGGLHKWLDLEHYFQLLRPADDLELVRYFTALVSGPSRGDQEIYLRALSTLPRVEIILGKFKTRRVRCRVQACTHAGNLFFLAPEEKRTDVDIGIHMLDDGHQNLCDRFIVVSGGSDLVPAINRTKERFPSKEVIVDVPSRSPVRGAAVELRSAADKNKTLPLQILPHAQLPATLPDGAGGTLTKPADW